MHGSIRATYKSVHLLSNSSTVIELSLSNLGSFAKTWLSSMMDLKLSYMLKGHSVEERKLQYKQASEHIEQKVVVWQTFFYRYRSFARIGCCKNYLQSKHSLMKHTALTYLFESCDFYLSMSYSLIRMKPWSNLIIMWHFSLNFGKEQ